MVESHFNHHLLWRSLVTILLGLATMTSHSLLGVPKLPVLLCVGGIFLIAVLCWLGWLKSVRIWNDQIEVRHTFLPFIKRTYWFREFEYFHIEQDLKWRTLQETLYLIRDGRRAVKLSTETYANYGELKQAVAVIGQQHRNDSDVRAVDSVFAKGHLASVMSLLFFVLLGLAIPVVKYLEAGQVTSAVIGLGLLVSVFFLAIFVGEFFPYKRLTIWRGRLEVKRLLWPFSVRVYSVEDFEIALEVITPTPFGPPEISLWLFQADKLAVSIPQAVYANYDALLNAMEIVPNDAVELTPFKKLRYYLGKTIEL